MTKSLLIACCLLLAFNLPFESLAQCGCNFTIAPGAGAITFDGNTNGVKPGDVICLQAGLRGKITFQNLKGSADKYITIKNCGGKAEVGGPASSNAIAFYGCRYFRMTGTGESGVNYGIKVIESKPGSQGVVCSGLSSDFELDHLEIQKAGFAGIMAKTDPSCDEASTRPNFTMYNVKIHDNYFHEITGEGIYLGNSFYSGTSQYCGYMQYSHEVRGVRVYNNIVDGSGWEAIQIGAAVNDVEVYNNRVYNYGTQNKSAQNGGIQLGSGSTGRVYNNFIKNGTGPGFWIQGIGNLYFYNNIVINPGYEAFNVNVRPTPLASDIVPNGFIGGVYILNNTIVSAAYAAIRENINEAKGNVFSNNLIVNSASNWNQLKSYTDWTQNNNLVIQNLADAKFTNPNGDDYSLQPSSPAINAGVDLRGYGVTIDHKFATRPSGGKYDVGAFEYIGGGPQCNAGGDKNLTLPVNTVVLNGTGSSTNGSITTWSWTKKSGGAANLQNANTANLTVTGLAQGVYEFQLEVTDNAGVKATAVAKVTVVAAANTAPTANAGANQTISLPTNSLVLTGSGFDPDGTISKYEWTKLNGPNVTIAGANTASLQLTNLLQGEYNFQLTVTDDDGGTGTASVKVTVNAAPVNQVPTVNAGADVVLYLPVNSVNITAQGADRDGSIKSYLWEKRSGGAADIVNPSNSTVTLQNLTAGIYVFRVTVKDNVDASAYDEVQVNVIQANQPPTASAGNDITITLPQTSVTLNGQGTDGDGTIATYAWTKSTSLTANIVSANQASTVIDQLVQGVHKFGLTVTDDDGATSYDEVTVTVNGAPVNVRPVVNAGTDKSIQLPVNSISLTGMATDSDGSITQLQWSKSSGPAATLTNTNAQTLQVTDMVAGTYVFTFSATDNAGATVRDNVQVVVFPSSVNQPPLANAGGNLVITLPDNSITLNGAGSDPDGSVASYEWSQENGPSATINTNGNVLNITDMVEGVYTFKLVVVDNNGATNSDFATVSVNASNLAPIIEEPIDLTVKLPTTSTQVKTVARDPDGTIASYAWTQIEGTAATLANAGTSTLSASDLQVGDYKFRVSVTDNDGSASMADYSLKVLAANNNMPPLANAGKDISIYLPTNSVRLTGSATDQDGSIAQYRWTLVSGSFTIATPNAATTQIQNLTVGIHKVRLTVTDNSGDTDTDDIEIIVNPIPSNQPPVVSAGGNKNIQLPTRSVTLSGRATDPDGTISTYVWTQITGPAATIRNANRAATNVDGLAEGKYVFRLRATDNKGASAFDEVIVTVLPGDLNQAPTVTAGSNQSIVLPINITNLIGIASDADGSIASYSWTKQSGPAATLTNAATSIATIENLVEGSYVYRLTVVDNAGASSYDEVQITVSATGANIPPVADAGGNQSIILPTNTINLFGTGTDQDGTVTSYQWIKTSGGNATLENQNDAVLTVKNLDIGSYTFRLTVTDNNGESNSDFVTVVVNPATINLPPIVKAGMDQTLYLPNNTTSLVGDALDIDGQITTLQWTQQNGTAVSLTTTNEKNLLLRTLTAGAYVFRLSATDNGGASAYDEATVTVLSIPNNVPPNVNAGPDVELYLPLAQYTLKGTANDPDGTIKSYSWTKVQGPAVTMTDTETDALTISNFAAGVYRFRLKVLDNESRGSTDDVIVTVLPAAVNRSPVVTLQSTAEVTLPTNRITLTATTKDDDGTIVSTTWTQTSGSPMTVSGANTNSLTVTDLVAGTYIFRITVVDDKGAEASAQVTLKVNPVPPNQAPIVNAGPNQNITVPATVQLSGAAVDTDGQVTSVAWTQEEGASVTLTDAGTLKAKTSEITAAGIYVFRLSATDDKGEVGYSEVTIYATTEDQTQPFKADFVKFAVANQTEPASIDTVANRIDVEVKIVSNNYVMTPSFELSPLATARVNGALQTSGVSEHDFTNPVTYTVMAADSLTEKIWTVHVAGIVQNPEPGAPIGPTTPVYPLFFSPNADGQNDTWSIGNFSSIGTCVLEVYARNGQQVYRNSQFENNWDGTANGRPIVSGDYYYLISRQGAQIASGSLRIIR